MLRCVGSDPDRWYCDGTSHLILCSWIIKKPQYSSDASGHWLGLGASEPACVRIV